MNWLYLTLPFALLAVLALVWWLRRPKGPPAGVGPPGRLTGPRTPVSVPRVDPDAQAAQAARAKLAGRVSQDKADDLIAGVKERHPDRNERWCAEKALWDYERDHGG